MTWMDALDVRKVVLVAAGEEKLGGDERTNEGSDTVPRLRELKPVGSGAGRGHDSDVRVGGNLKGSETTGGETGQDDEAGKASLLVVGAGELGNGPKQHGAGRVQDKTHNDGELVAFAAENLTGHGGEGEVTDAEVGDLETGRLKLGDLEDLRVERVGAISQCMQDMTESVS